MSAEPRDHPALQLYPDCRTILWTDDDGIRWRVPVDRPRDDARPVPVTDLAQASSVVAALIDLLRDPGEVSDPAALRVGSRVRPPRQPDPSDRAEVVEQLRGLLARLRSDLPQW